MLCPLQVFDIDPASCLVVSAKHGRGLDAVLSAIVEHIPAPQVPTTAQLARRVSGTAALCSACSTVSTTVELHDGHEH